MDKEDLIQGIFIAFMVAVFFEVFHFISWTFLEYRLIPLTLVESFFMKGLLIGVLWLLVFGLIYKYPSLLKINDKNTLELIRLIFMWSFIIILISNLIWLIAIMIKAASSPSVMQFPYS